MCYGPRYWHTTKKKKKNWHANFVFFAREFRVFRSILVQLKGVGLSCFHSFDRLWYAFSVGRLCSRIPLFSTVNCRDRNSHLHCCPSATIIICRTGYILIEGRGHLELIPLPMKISVTSRNYDKRVLLSTNLWSRARTQEVPFIKLIGAAPVSCTMIASIVSALVRLSRYHVEVACAVI